MTEVPALRDPRQDGRSTPIIQGDLLKFDERRQWWLRSGATLPEEPIINIGTARAVYHWAGQQPVEILREEPGEPKYDLAALNASIPRANWELGWDGQPKAPYSRQWIAYFFDPISGRRFTFANSTWGARMAVENLEDAIFWMRKFRNDGRVPIVELSTAMMGTKVGPKERPAFDVVSWHVFEPAKLEAGATAALPPTQHPAKPPLAEELDDDFPPDLEPVRTMSAGKGTHPFDEDDKPPLSVPRARRAPRPITRG